MGSEIITASVEQKGDFSLNSENLDPSTSRPVLQTEPTPSFTYQPLQQVSDFETNGETSAPIEQKEGVSFGSFDDQGDDAFLEQIRPTRLNDSAEPIEQLIFVTTNLRSPPAATGKVIEQRNVSRKTDTESTLEQKERVASFITIDQYEFAELIFPPCNSIKNPVTSSILWRIRDFGSPFDIGTLTFSVNGVQVEDSSEFTITALENGLQLDYDPPLPFAFDSQVLIALSVSDSAVPPNVVGEPLKIVLPPL
jgi:hypothetical protein